MTYTLTAEEYILSLLLLDGAEVAASIKDEVFGDISDQLLECRLDSATSGLISKGLLSVDGSQEKVDEQFQNFLMGLTKVKRIIRGQIATDEGASTVSLFCDKDFTVQQSLYDNRVFKLFGESDEQKLGRLMDLSFNRVEGQAFSVKEPQFEKVVDKLLAGRELTAEESSLFDPHFLDVLVAKKGKLNSLYDYRLGEQVAIGALLYISSGEQTWFIENNEDNLIIAPFSFGDLFE
ncbi:hypothetical protein FZC74_12295 [Sutcliffiella horikoshii]|uniref:Uncharacterized protein n=1 Tax=Sutcliffiella horikoshii TaxID=79883 RepID=A0AA94WPR6_9BACI|nr:hypothetical protein [Sutcliffiella horikoshii]TYS58579.1 hypothetical protein FZC74_12295 [Sutcliffiella horikoshii]